MLEKLATRAHKHAQATHHRWNATQHYHQQRRNHHHHRHPVLPSLLHKLLALNWGFPVSYTV